MSTIYFPTPLEAHLLEADGYAIVNTVTGEAVACAPDEESAFEHAIYLCMDAENMRAYVVRPFRYLPEE